MAEIKVLISVWIYTNSVPDIADLRWPDSRESIRRFARTRLKAQSSTPTPVFQRAANGGSDPSW